MRGPLRGDDEKEHGDHRNAPEQDGGERVIRKFGKMFQ